MTLPTEIQAAEKGLKVVLTAHHIVLYLALAGALAFGIYAVESKIASLQEARAQAAETALAVEKDHSAQLVAAFTANEAQRQAERAQALTAITQIQSQTKVQIVHDTALPAPELGHRIEDLTGFKQNSITLDSSQDLIVPLPLGQKIVGLLDQGQADAQTVVKQEAVIGSQAKTISDENTIIAEDKKVLTEQIDTDKKVLSAEKAKCRKSKFKVFFAGVIIGYLGRAITAH